MAGMPKTFQIEIAQVRDAPTEARNGIERALRAPAYHFRLQPKRIARPSLTAASEVQFQGKLENTAGAVDRRNDMPEIGVADIRLRVGEDHVVEHLERLRAKCQVARLAQWTNGELLGQCQVEALLAGTLQNVAAAGAE